MAQIFLYIYSLQVRVNNTKTKPFVHRGSVLSAELRAQADGAALGEHRLADARDPDEQHRRGPLAQQRLHALAELVPIEQRVLHVARVDLRRCAASARTCSGKTR